MTAYMLYNTESKEYIVLCDKCKPVVVDGPVEVTIILRDDEHSSVQCEKCSMNISLKR